MFSLNRLLIAVAALAAAGCGLNPVQERAPCQTSQQCALGSYCQGGVCAEPTDADVPVPSDACAPEDNATFCLEHPWGCGSEVTAIDNCGWTRSVFCSGGCVTFEDAGSPDACFVMPDYAFCQDGYGRYCGQRHVIDNCGYSRVVQCGNECPDGYACDLSGMCMPPIDVAPDACTPESDQDLCQRQYMDCGTFATTDSCGALRKPWCGDCRSGFTCDGANHCVQSSLPDACVPESDGEFCWRRDADCGQVTGPDSCGQPRSVYCGSCQYGWQCDWAVNQCQYSFPVDAGTIDFAPDAG